MYNLGLVLKDFNSVFLSCSGKRLKIWCLIFFFCKLYIHENLKGIVVLYYDIYYFNDDFVVLIRFKIS